jgi:hypothetical protein
MKLRIKGDTVRFRVPPSGLESLMRDGKLTSQVRFSLRPNGSLFYSLMLDESIDKATVSFAGNEITARLPKAEAIYWASTDTVGLGGEIQLDESSLLTLLVEKDFACLDRSDEENEDTYPNPNAGQAC